jgi:hypothetical protein
LHAAVGSRNACRFEELQEDDNDENVWVAFWMWHRAHYCHIVQQTNDSGAAVISTFQPQATQLLYWQRIYPFIDSQSILCLHLSLMCHNNHLGRKKDHSHSHGRHERDNDGNHSLCTPHLLYEKLHLLDHPSVRTESVCTAEATIRLRQHPALLTSPDSLFGPLCPPSNRDTSPFPPPE